MECSTISFDCDETLTCLKRKIQKARKTHTCGECLKQINPGEKYEHVDGLLNGEFQTHKTCSDCLSLRDSFFSNDFYFEEVRGDIKNFINDCRGSVAEKTISILTPVARAWVCELIEKIWESEN